MALGTAQQFVVLNFDVVSRLYGQIVGTRLRMRAPMRAVTPAAMVRWRLFFVRHNYDIRMLPLQAVKDSRSETGAS